MGNICSPRFLRTFHSHVKCLLHLLPEKKMFFDNSKDGKSKLTPRHHYLLLRHRIIICLCKQLHYKTHRKKRVLIRAPLNMEIIELLFRKGEVYLLRATFFIVVILGPSHIPSLSRQSPCLARGTGRPWLRTADTRRRLWRAGWTWRSPHIFSTLQSSRPESGNVIFPSYLHVILLPWGHLSVWWPL